MTIQHTSAHVISKLVADGSYTKRSKIAGNYAALNGLRFIAALAVVCFHYCPPVVSWVDRLFAVGPAAVGFFFLLSGFVLALHHPAISDRARFRRARLLRIYPMYIFAFLLFLPIAVAKYHHNPKLFLASMAVNLPMMQAWTSLSQSWNGPSWSLSVEAFMYLLFPFLVCRIGKRNNLGLWTALAVVPSLATFAVSLQWVPVSLWRSWIGNNPVFWLPLFCFGISLGLRRDQSGNLGFARHGEKHLMDMAIFTLLGLLAVLAIMWPVQYREVLINGGAAILFGLIVLFCTYRSLWAERLLGNRTMDRLGKASYITYIIQAPLWHYFLAASNFLSHRALSDSTATASQFVLFTVLLVCVSACLDLFVDEPVRSWFNRRSKALSLAPAVCPTAKATRVA